MTFEKLQDIALVVPGTSPKGELINSAGLGLPFFQGSKEFNELYPVPERYTEFPVKVANNGDVLISVRAPVGEVNIAQEDCSIGRGVMSVRAKNKSEQIFLFYFLKSLQGKWDSLGSTGSVFENLSTVALNNVEIPVGLKRVAIGEILFKLDQKIASNRALSKTLEDIAQTLFKSWFMDFDPVKAKMAGEKPAGMDAATAALFPDSMVESELGLIPKGWCIATVKSLTRTLVGGTPSRVREDFWNGDIPWFNSGKVNEFRIIEPSEYITELGLQKSAAKLLPIGTTVLAITGATLGQYSRVEISASGTQNVIGILESDSISNEYIYSFIASGISRIVAAGTGGAQQHINKDIVDNFEFIFPGKNLVDMFTLNVGSMFQQISLLTFNSRNLSRLRDALLPRLISGELQIPKEMLAS